MEYKGLRVMDLRAIMNMALQFTYTLCTLEAYSKSQLLTVEVCLPPKPSHCPHSDQVLYSNNFAYTYAYHIQPLDLTHYLS